jgi:hypothetical protein
MKSFTNPRLILAKKNKKVLKIITNLEPKESGVKEFFKNWLFNSRLVIFFGFFLNLNVFIDSF